MARDRCGRADTLAYGTCGPKRKRESPPQPYSRRRDGSVGTRVRSRSSGAAPKVRVRKKGKRESGVRARLRTSVHKQVSASGGITACSSCGRTPFLALRACLIASEVVRPVGRVRGPVPPRVPIPARNHGRHAREHMPRKSRACAIASCAQHPRPDATRNDDGYEATHRRCGVSVLPASRARVAPCQARTGLSVECEFCRLSLIPAEAAPAA